jgi:hypothetical protein
LKTTESSKNKGYIRRSPDKLISRLVGILAMDSTEVRKKLVQLLFLHPIIHTETLFSGGNQARVLQNPVMMGHSRSAQLESALKFATSQLLAVEQHLYHLIAGRSRESSEDLDRLLREIGNHTLPYLNTSKILKQPSDNTTNVPICQVRRFTEKSK